MDYITLKRNLRELWGDMKKSPFQAGGVLFLCLLILVGFAALTAYFGSWSSSSQTPGTTFVDQSITQEANDNSSSTITQIANQESRYNWANKSSWQAEESGSGYQVNLLFVSEGPVIPVTPCLTIISDATVISTGPIGSSVTWAKNTNDPEEFIQCFSGLNNTVTFQTFFETKPRTIEASLIQSDVGSKVLNGEPSFMLPVVN